MREEREPKPMGQLVDMLIRGRGWNERLAMGRLRSAWGTIVGERVAARSEPVSLRRGVLTIRAEAGAWASELTLLGPTIARAVGEHLEDVPVREVQVVAGLVRPQDPGVDGAG